MDFVFAFARLKAGGVLSREAWNGTSRTLCIQLSDNESKMTRDYLYISGPDAFRVPYMLTQEDLFAEDWFEIDP